jgi:hypothetical protein
MFVYNGLHQLTEPHIMTLTAWEDLSRNEQLHAEYYEFYKEVYNVRPRHIYRNGGEPAYSEQQMEQMLKDLSVAAESVVAEQEEATARATAKFEALIMTTVAAGAADRQTALRWIMDASDCDGDWERLCYHHNLPFSYFKEGSAA